MLTIPKAADDEAFELPPRTGDFRPGELVRSNRASPAVECGLLVAARYVSRFEPTDARVISPFDKPVAP